VYQAALARGDDTPAPAAAHGACTFRRSVVWQNPRRFAPAALRAYMHRHDRRPRVHGGNVGLLADARRVVVRQIVLLIAMDWINEELASFRGSSPILPVTLPRGSRSRIPSGG
jgi:hypothetical protein